MIYSRQSNRTVRATKHDKSQRRAIHQTGQWTKYFVIIFQHPKSNSILVPFPWRYLLDRAGKYISKLTAVVIIWNCITIESRPDQANAYRTGCAATNSLTDSISARRSAKGFCENSFSTSTPGRKSHYIHNFVIRWKWHLLDINTYSISKTSGIWHRAFFLKKFFV